MIFPDTEDFTPEKIKAGRAFARLSQKELADLAQVSKPTIANIETGKSLGHPRTLRNIKAALESAGVSFKPGGWIMQGTAGVRRKT